uniref:7TM_GPCR_Srx domain-containing protein n=1 Tax=Steinernema glaseri TaxID=37863 RepID=A0A1I8AJP9_9BILA
MLFFHLCIKTLLAACTLAYAISFFIEMRHSFDRGVLVFSTTLTHQSLLLVTTVSDLLLTIDRLIAISAPVRYRETLLAACTLAYAISFFIEMRHSFDRGVLVFSTTLTHQSLLLVTTVSDLLLTIDRLLAISAPVRYREVKKMMLIMSMLICTVIFICTACIFFSNRTSVYLVSLVWIEEVSPLVASVVLYVTLATMLSIIGLGVVLIMKIRAYDQKVALQRNSEKIFKMVNNVVFQQIVMATAIWIVPFLIRQFIEHILLVVIPVMSADPNVTLIMIYAALCSIMYWKTMVYQRAAA